MDHVKSKPNTVSSAAWSGGEVDALFGRCATLKDVIDMLEVKYALSGEVICEIRVNSLLLREEDEIRFADSPRSEIHDLSIVISRSTDLICQALRSVAAFMPRVQESCVRTSDSIRDQGLASASHAVKEIAEGCQWAVETLIHARGAASGIGLPLQLAERWLEGERALARATRELIAAYEAKDGALVADILEYEATASADIWIEAIERELSVRAPDMPVAEAEVS